MSDNRHAIADALMRVEETLQTAEYGWHDMQDPQRARRLTGLRNLIVFGRSTTFVLQNLRSVVGAEEFDKWYGPEQEALKASSVMRYFVSARNDLEKQGRLHLSMQAQIHNFNSNDIHKYGPRPPGATAFFIGDQLGGSGWEVPLADGTTQKYYVNIPAETAQVTQHFSNFSSESGQDIDGRSIDELCRLYIDTLRGLVKRARERFLGEPKEAQRTRGHLRVVK